MESDMEHNDFCFRHQVSFNETHDDECPACQLEREQQDKLREHPFQKHTEIMHEYDQNNQRAECGE